MSDFLSRPGAALSKLRAMLPLAVQLLALAFLLAAFAISGYWGWQNYLEHVREPRVRRSRRGASSVSAPGSKAARPPPPPR